MKEKWNVVNDWFLKTTNNVESLMTGLIKLCMLLVAHLTLITGHQLGSYGPGPTDLIVIISIILTIVFMLFPLSKIVIKDSSRPFAPFASVAIDWFPPAYIVYKLNPARLIFHPNSIAMIISYFAVIGALSIFIANKTVGMFLMRLKFKQELNVAPKSYLAKIKPTFIYALVVSSFFNHFTFLLTLIICFKYLFELDSAIYTGIRPIADTQTNP